MARSPHMIFDRAAWSQLRGGARLTLSEPELAALRGLKTAMSLDEVVEVYLPLARLIWSPTQGPSPTRPSSGAPLPEPPVGPRSACQKAPRSRGATCRISCHCSKGASSIANGSTEK